MNRWFALIPAVLAAFSLTACGQVETDGGTVPPAAKTTVQEPGDTPDTAPAEVPRAVMADGVLYCDAGRESSVTGRCGNLDGEITARCAADALPQKDGECNFTGADGWQRGPEEGTVEVHMDDGTWQVFSAREP